MKPLVVTLMTSLALSGCAGSVGPAPAVPSLRRLHDRPAGGTKFYFTLVGGVPASGPASRVKSFVARPFSGSGKALTYTVTRSACGVPRAPRACGAGMLVRSVTQPWVMDTYDQPEGHGRRLSSTVVIGDGYSPIVQMTLLPTVVKAGIVFANPNPNIGKPVQVVLTGIARDEGGNFIIGPAPYSKAIALSATRGVRLSSHRVVNAVHPVWAAYNGGYEDGTVTAQVRASPGDPPREATFRPLLSSAEKQTLLTSSASASPALVEASDGSVWMSVFTACSLVKIYSNLTTQPYPVPSAIACPSELTKGPDGNLWFTAGGAPSFGRGGGSGIGMATPAGAMKSYLYSSSAGLELGPITSGPDGKLWMVDVGTGDIYSATTSGQFTTASYSLQAPSAKDIVTGPDGNLWITDWYGSNYGFFKVAAAGTFVAHYSVVGPTAMCVRGAYVYALLGANGPTQSVGQWDSSGNLVRKYTPIDKYMTLSQIAVGPDGALWFGLHAGASNGGMIELGRISSKGSYSEVVIPYATLDNSSVSGLVAGGDGNLYYTRGDYLGKIALPVSAGSKT